MAVKKGFFAYNTTHTCPPPTLLPVPRIGRMLQLGAASCSQLSRVGQAGRHPGAGDIAGASSMTERNGTVTKWKQAPKQTKANVLG